MATLKRFEIADDERYLKVNGNLYRIIRDVNHRYGITTLFAHRRRSEGGWENVHEFTYRWR